MIDEACVVARVGRNSLYLALQGGALRARKLRTKTVILVDDLRAWLESLPLASFSNACEPRKTFPRESSPPVRTAAAPSPKRRLIAAE
ncbi:MULTISPECIES: helix-turn-helix domain-containing protein [Bradyrhizobium]|uniref:helix-turn-helix domain-containing protein n=1 Tax=Bradyrhizobium TaxID=374 RepID=UPI0012FD2CB8|nr:MULTISPECIES: helix-turn-helix domain-containing protein [Bradyrhizobium]MDI2071058.1 helix-turn-helix domain-containing protein [Bradyrhizobium sp. Mp27]